MPQAKNSTRKGRRPRRAQRTPNLVGPVMLKAKLNGKSITPPQDPPVCTTVPWNTLTLNYGGTSTSQFVNFRASSLIATLAAQISITTPDTTQLEIRVLSMRAWNLTSPRMAYVAYDFTPRPVSDANIAVLKQQEDTASKNHFARLGFIWPQSCQNVALRSEETKIFEIETAAVTDDFTVRVNILWRTAPSSASLLAQRQPMP